MSSALYSSAIQIEEDVVSVRRNAREISALLGFDGNDQTRIATAVSEIARYAFSHAGGGTAEFFADTKTGWFTVRISDSSGGMGGLTDVLNRGDSSGAGVASAQRLMDDFRVESQDGKCAVVTLAKRLTPKAPKTPQRLAELAATIAKSSPRTVLDELREQNREMARVMSELRARQNDLVRLNAELEDTNRGVVALYAELDEKAENLRRAGQMKSRFLSYMSHEFRTPLTSIMALTRLLIDEADGKLAPEQHKQTWFIRKSAESLLEMVNDLLDLARVESGKDVVRPTVFTVANLFAALQGVLKPLRGVIRQLSRPEDVELIFEDASEIPELYTDETKLTQILRNFISNALKFTGQGEVRVHAGFDKARQFVVFSVADTGIGIDAAHLDAIFQEFAQIDTPVQQKVSGSGLGLPLARGLAELLGGSVHVESAPGAGSTFYAEIPIQYEPLRETPEDAIGAVLLIDDEEVSRYLVRQALGPSIPSIEAADGPTGIEMARIRRPRAIVLDLHMPQVTGFDVLRELRTDPTLNQIPVIIMTAKALTAEEMAVLTEQADAVLSKELLSQPGGPDRLRMAIAGERISQ